MIYSTKQHNSNIRSLILLSLEKKRKEKRKKKNWWKKNGRRYRDTQSVFPVFLIPLVFSTGPRVTRRDTWREFRMRGTSVMPLVRLIAAGLRSSWLAARSARRGRGRELTGRTANKNDRSFSSPMTYRGKALPTFPLPGCYKSLSKSWYRASFRDQMYK